MRPVIWSDRRATAIAVCAVAWLVSIEVRTSRSASRAAARSAGVLEEVVDTGTSRVFDAAAATAIAGGLTASLTRPQQSIRPPGSAFLSGLSILAASGALSVVARRHLGRFHRDSLTIHHDHELVETGPYRRIRHPLYTATIGVFIGMGAVLGNWISVALAALPTAALVHRVTVEENMLSGVLGERYSEYSKRTARFVPRVW